jgi:glycerophosphoryl diester phosphodiesterase
LKNLKNTVLISAHRAGAGDQSEREGTLRAVREAVARHVDYVEFDLQRRADGSLAVAHDDDGRPDPVRPAELVALLPPARAHIDLKFCTPGGKAEIDAVRQVLAGLGPGPHLVTTGRVASARALRDWADAGGADLLVGISIGGSVTGLPLKDKIRTRLGELFCGDRVRESRADVLAAHQVLAMLTLRRLARRLERKLMVWTPDHPLLLRYWLAPGRVWMVTTDHTARAIEIRGRFKGGRI